jgi:hypothetical protein
MRPFFIPFPQTDAAHNAATPAPAVSAWKSFSRRERSHLSLSDLNPVKFEIALLAQLRYSFRNLRLLRSRILSHSTTVEKLLESPYP